MLSAGGSEYAHQLQGMLQSESCPPALLLDAPGELHFVTMEQLQSN
jgi:hypothetical protein